jgi:hypothetical protein
VPPPTVFASAVWIRFPLTVIVPLAGRVKLFAISVTLPDVLSDRLSKTLPLIVVASGPAVPDPARLMPVNAAVAARVQPEFAIVLSRISTDEVAVEVPDSTAMPSTAPPATPLRTETWLLRMTWVSVPVGAALAATTKMPRSVPDVTPPTELVMVLCEIV